MARYGKMAVAIGVMLAALLGSEAAQADETVTVRVRSNYEYKVQIAFFSQSRSYVWPGPERAYPLDDSRTHEFPLACRTGEEICYGAWVTGEGTLYWGVGPENNRSCRNCCFVCGDGDRTPILSLND